MRLNIFFLLNNVTGCNFLKESSCRWQLTTDQKALTWASITANSYLFYWDQAIFI